jgi:DNA-binding SARP family transcriptional activator
MDPLGEPGARRLMSLLARAGERAGALEIYAELERRLERELELEPSPETARLAAEIRTFDTQSE